jgi:preprotein translocase SecE subunit
MTLLLIALSLWVAYRLVNHPTFADFLIATEAEMNKVSWTPRRRLIQDTIVVLTTVLILTLFLFVVDVFWGWLLSRSFIGVLQQTEYKYMVVLERVADPEKKDALVAVLSEGGTMTDAAARNILETVPGGGTPGKGIELRVEVVRTGLNEDDADALAQKLREAGGQVSIKRSRGQQGAGQLRW